MKKHSLKLFLIILSIYFSACNVTSESQVEKLKKENKELREEIKYLKKSKIIGTKMLPFPNKNEYLSDEKGVVSFVTHDISNFLINYNVYKVKNNGEKGELILKNQKTPKFDYKFDLSKMASNTISLIMEFKTENETIHVPVKATLKIKK